MPRPWFVQPPARNGLGKAYIRPLRDFSSAVISQDRLRLLVGGRKRSYVSASATCCTQI